MTHFFSFLEKWLKGIPIHTVPVLGPAPEGSPAVLPPKETRYKVLGYLDDVKPAITDMSEFRLIDEASYLFERASGCRLHRSPTSDKCKFLPLSIWQDTLQQEQIPLPYLKLSKNLDFLGVSLFASYTETRKINREILTNKI